MPLNRTFRDTGASPQVLLRDLSVLACVDPQQEQSAAFIREMQRSRAEVRHVWPLPMHLSAEADILVCDYMQNLGAALPWVPGEASSALVVLLPQNGNYDNVVLETMAPHAVIQRPVQDQFITTSLFIAWSQFRYERRLRDRIARLDENLRALRDIERAKLAVMADKQVDEKVAYEHLRNLAMKRRVTVGDVAAEILENVRHED